jgi:hypothetical protein
MAVLMITTVKNFIGLSTDTKPTTEVPPGSTFWEHDTNCLYKTYDGTNWEPYQVLSINAVGTFNLQQAANTYDLFTATGGTVYVTKFNITLPNVNCADDANITSLSVVTDTGTVITLLSTGAGAKANLTANASFTYSTPFWLPTGKKIRGVIAGGAADASTLCTTLAKYQAVTPAGYLA